jgi:ABC-2 type transport system permease protein
MVKIRVIPNIMKSENAKVIKYQQNRWLIKIFTILELLILGFMGLFYYSCGEQLYVRESGGNIAEFGATNDTGELVKGVSVEQTYTSVMDQISKIGVMVSNYGQAYTSKLYIDIQNVTRNQMIAKKTFDVANVGLNQYVYVKVPEKTVVYRGDIIKISITSDAESGNAPTVLYNAGYTFEQGAVGTNAALYINNNIVPGTLCISAEGKDFVWTGPNYWKIVCLVAGITACLYWILAWRFKKGKNSYFFSLFGVVKKYGFLIKQLVSRDFKTRYKRSILGVFWSFLNPLLMMIVQYLVFSQLFKSDIDNYPVYLLSGLVIFNFFNEGVGQALTSIVGNAPLITKVYLPKYVYPVTRVLSSGINLLMSWIPLIIAALITGESITKAYWMVPYILICLMIFTMGWGMVMAAGMTFFRDLQFLWGIFSMVWMYLTPIFYPLSIVPKEIRGYFEYNPMLHYVNAIRAIVLDGVTPKPIEFMICTVSALIMLLLGGFIFKKTQDKFIFYI